MKKVQCGKSRGWAHQPERMGITYETSEHQTSQLSWCPRTRDYAPSLLTAGPNDARENTFTNAILGAGQKIGDQREEAKTNAGCVLEIHVRRIDGIILLPSYFWTAL